MKKVSDAVLLDAYARLGSVCKVGAEVGLCGQSVHERLVKLRANRHLNLWTAADDARLLASDYRSFRDRGLLAVLAKRFGRTRHFLCRKARRLGLTDREHPRVGWTRAARSAKVLR